MYRTGFFLAILILAGGCQVLRWHDVPPFESQRAQAADGSIAVVRQNYQVNREGLANPGALLGLSKNHQHQIFVARDGVLQALTGKRAGADEPGTLHYRKTYVLIGVRADKDKVRYEQIDTASAQVRLLSTSKGGMQTALCQGGSQAFVVENLAPNPDGGLFAHVYSPVCGLMRVEFLSASDGRVVEIQEVAVTGVNLFHWDAGGDLLVYAINQPGQAWRLRPGNAPARIAYTPPPSL
jgi:hypothetical protein